MNFKGIEFIVQSYQAPLSKNHCRNLYKIVCFASLDFSVQILSGLTVTAALLCTLNLSFFPLGVLGCLKDLRLATVALSWHI